MNGIKKSLKIIFLYTTSLFVVLSIISDADIIGYEKHFLNSDTMYLPSIYNDIFKDGNSIKTFHLNPAPNFFPDMGVHFLLMKVFNSNFNIVATVFASIQIFSIILLLLQIFKRVNKRNKLIRIGLSALFIFAIPSLYENDFLFTFYFIINSYHLGSFIISLLLIIISHDIIYIKKKNYLLLISLTFLALISDKSIIINFVIPIILTLAILLFLDKVDKKRSLKLLSSIGTGIVLGLSFLFIVDKFSILDIPSAQLSIDFDKALSSLFFFTTQTYSYIRNFTSISLIILLSILSYILNIVFLFQRKKAHILFELYVFIFTTFLILAPILSGKITGLDSIRYNYHLMIILIAFLPYFFTSVILKNKQRLNYKFEIALPILFIIIISTKFSYKKLVEKINIYPLETKLIDKLKVDLNLKNGLASYWKSKKNTMFSKNEIRIRSIHENLVPYKHVSNDSWYYEKGESITFNFILADDESMLKNISQQLEIFKIINVSENLTIVKTEEFTFDETFKIIKKKHTNHQIN